MFEPPIAIRHQMASGSAAALLQLAMLLPVAGIVQAADAAKSTETAPMPMQRVEVQVPRTLRLPPFDITRHLQVPAGFAIDVAARVPDARFMVMLPNRDMLVSNPENGSITLVRPAEQSGASPIYQGVFASGLHHPHDLALHRVRGIDYLYIAESDRIARTRYQPGAIKIGPLETIVADLPDASTAELNGRYGHQLKNIALHGDELYVSIASTCNVCASDLRANPVRAAIHAYDADGGGGRLYARGLRNAEGVRFQPGTDVLWAAVNSRDNIAFPFHRDLDGDGSDDYGKVLPGYVDQHPPDLLTRVRDGGNYGWPYCNPNPDQGLDAMPYDRDVQLNADGGALDCNTIDRVTKGIAAHSAPLGLNFLQEPDLPDPFNNAMLVALHGCWNCTRLNGHKVVMYGLREDGTPGDAMDLVSGWITDAEKRQRWGRPVAALGDGKGNIYISDDFSGTIYRLRRLTPAGTSAAAPDQPARKLHEPTSSNQNAR